MPNGTTDDSSTGAATVTTISVPVAGPAIRLALQRKDIEEHVKDVVATAGDPDAGDALQHAVMVSAVAATAAASGPEFAPTTSPVDQDAVGGFVSRGVGRGRAERRGQAAVDKATELISLAASKPRGLSPAQRAVVAIPVMAVAAGACLALGGLMKETLDELVLRGYYRGIYPDATQAAQVASAAAKELSYGLAAIVTLLPALLTVLAARLGTGTKTLIVIGELSWAVGFGYLRLQSTGGAGAAVAYSLFEASLSVIFGAGLLMVASFLERGVDDFEERTATERKAAAARAAAADTSRVAAATRIAEAASNRLDGRVHEAHQRPWQMAHAGAVAVEAALSRVLELNTKQVKADEAAILAAQRGNNLPETTT